MFICHFLIGKAPSFCSTSPNPPCFPVFSGASLGHPPSETVAQRNDEATHWRCSPAEISPTRWAKKKKKHFFVVKNTGMSMVLSKRIICHDIGRL